MDGSFDLKLIPLFDGAELVVGWMEKAGLVCRLCIMKWLKHVIPLGLTRGTLAAYRLPYILAFATDEFSAYEQFMHAGCNLTMTFRSVRAMEACSVVWHGEQLHTRVHICDWATSPVQTTLCIIENRHFVY